MTTDREGEREKEKSTPFNSEYWVRSENDVLSSAGEKEIKGEGGGRGVAMRSVVQEEKTKGVKWMRGKTAEKQRSVAETGTKLESRDKEPGRGKDQKMDWREEKLISNKWIGEANGKERPQKNDRSAYIQCFETTACSNVETLQYITPRLNVQLAHSQTGFNREEQKKFPFCGLVCCCGVNVTL